MWSASPRAGGCDFAVDPALRGDQVRPVWLPRHNGRLALITSSAPRLRGSGLALDLGSLPLIEAASEGVYHAADRFNGVDVLRLAPDSPPNAVLIPLDDLFIDRIAIALRVWRATRRGEQPLLPKPTSAQLRRRRLMLRAVDAHLAGTPYRDIAIGLFGAERVPEGSAWRQHHLRSLTIRLVQDGADRLHGGYLRLLRPDRRER